MKQIFIPTNLSANIKPLNGDKMMHNSDVQQHKLYDLRIDKRKYKIAPQELRSHLHHKQPVSQCPCLERTDIKLKLCK